MNLSVFSKQNVIKIKKINKRGGLLDMNMLNKSTEFQGSITSKRNAAFIDTNTSDLSMMN